MPKPWKITLINIIFCFVHTVADADLWRRDRCCGRMMTQLHRGMLGKASSKKTAATYVRPALHKATDELKWRKKALIILMFMFFPSHLGLNFGLQRQLQVWVPLSNFVTLKSIRKLRMAVKIPRAA